MTAAADRDATLRDAMDRYYWSIDTHDVEPFVANFVPDGVYETPWGVSRGHDEIRAAIGQWHASGITAGKRHFSGPAHIEYTGDSARVETSYFILEVEKQPGVVASGTYSDVWVRRDGRWLLQSRKQTIDPSYPVSG